MMSQKKAPEQPHHFLFTKAETIQVLSVVQEYKRMIYDGLKTGNDS